MSVCLYQRLLLAAEPIWFSVTVYLLVGHRKVYSYFGREHHNLPLEKSPLEKMTPFPGGVTARMIYTNTKLKTSWKDDYNVALIFVKTVTCRWVGHTSRFVFRIGLTRSLEKNENITFNISYITYNFKH